MNTYFFKSYPYKISHKIKLINESLLIVDLDIISVLTELDINFTNL